MCTSVHGWPASSGTHVPYRHVHCTGRAYRYGVRVLCTRTVYRQAAIGYAYVGVGYGMVGTTVHIVHSSTYMTMAMAYS